MSSGRASGVRGPANVKTGVRNGVDSLPGIHAQAEAEELDYTSLFVAAGKIYHQFLEMLLRIVPNLKNIFWSLEGMSKCRVPVALVH